MGIWGHWLAVVLLVGGTVWVRAAEVTTTEVVGIDGEQVEFGIGRLDGLKRDARVTLLRPGEPIVHPLTGQVLGIPQEPVGITRIVRAEEHRAWGLMVKTYSNPQLGDLAEYEREEKTGGEEFLTQIAQAPELQPARSIRDSGIAAVLLMDAQIDHVTGLLMLRERKTPLPLLATPEVFSDISSGFPITGILSHYCGVQRQELPIDASAVHIPALPGLHLHTVALSSKPPPYSPFRGNPRPGDNIGLLITNPLTGAQAF